MDVTTEAPLSFTQEANRDNAAPWSQWRDAEGFVGWTRVRQIFAVLGQ
jgi:hypothetical protein